MGESSDSSVAAVEMVEEGQNQPKISPKRIKFQDITGDEDEISALTDHLLVEILSRLPSTRDAIRTGTLSKRWKHLWTAVHTLIFTDSVYPYGQKPTSSSDFVSFVDKTLTQCRQLKLKKFEVSISYGIQFESQFNNWIGYAISCNVEELVIILWHDSESKYILDQKVFTSSCFTDLSLDDCLFNPSGAISWKNLRRLWITNGQVNEDLIENILSGSPVLETLELDDCYGYKCLNITSKSVKELVLYGYMDSEDVCDDIIEINAPNILSLKIQGYLLLWKVLLLDVSCVVKANLDYKKMGGHGETTLTRKEAKEEMLKGFILNLSHVKELKIGGLCTKVLSRLEAKGFAFPSNIKFPSNWYDSDSDSDSVEGGEGEVL